MKTALRDSAIWKFTKKPAVLLTLRVIVSGLLLLYLARTSAFGNILRAFARIQPADLAAFFVLYFLSLGLQSVRWHYLLRAWGIVRGLPVLLRSIMIGLFFNNFLPGSLGGDAYRLYAGGRDTGKMEAVGASIFYERLLGYGSLVTLGLLVLVLRADPARDWLFWALLGTALFGLLALAALLSIPALGRLAQGLSDRYALARSLRLTDWLTSLRYDRSRWSFLFGAFLLSFLNQLADVLSFRVVAAALQLPVNFTDLLLFVPLLYLAIILPVSVNGIGVRESVFVAFAASWGIGSADAVAYSLTVFALGIAGSLAGGVLYWLDRPTRDGGAAGSAISR